MIVVPLQLRRLGAWLRLRRWRKIRARPYKHVRFTERGVAYVEPFWLTRSPEYKRQAEAARRMMARLRKRGTVAPVDPECPHVVALSAEATARLEALLAEGDDLARRADRESRAMQYVDPNLRLD